MEMEMEHEIRQLNPFENFKNYSNNLKLLPHVDIIAVHLRYKNLTQTYLHLNQVGFDYEKSKI